MASKHDKTGRSRRKLSSFIALEHYLLDCPAWRTLSLAGRSALIEIARHYRPGVNGRLAMSARGLADALPISRQTGTRALKELADRGFIEQVKAGGFNVKSGEGRATEWRLTMHPCDVTGQTPSRAFMRWHAGKIHFTASPESQVGLTREPRSADAQQNCRKVALS
jgi:DNA-binding HxlR family transcriptional regulator